LLTQTRRRPGQVAFPACLRGFAHPPGGMARWRIFVPGHDHAREITEGAATAVCGKSRSRLARGSIRLVACDIDRFRCEETQRDERSGV